MHLGLTLVFLVLAAFNGDCQAWLPHLMFSVANVNCFSTLPFVFTQSENINSSSRGLLNNNALLFKILDGLDRCLVIQ